VALEALDILVHSAYVIDLRDADEIDRCEATIRAAIHRAASGPAESVASDVPSAWRWQQLLDALDEVMTRWPDNQNGDCHLMPTSDVVRLRELCRDALRAAPSRPVPWRSDKKVAQTRAEFDRRSHGWVVRNTQEVLDSDVWLNALCDAVWQSAVAGGGTDG